MVLGGGGSWEVIRSWGWSFCVGLMAPHSSTLAWKIPWDGGAWWAAVHGVAKRQTWLSDFIFTFTFMHWRRKWHPTPALLPGKSHGTEEPGGLQSMGLLRVGHGWATSLSLILSCTGEGNGSPFQFLAWRTPGTGEPGGLPSVGSQSRTRLKRRSSSSAVCFCLLCRCHAKKFS